MINVRNNSRATCNDVVGPKWTNEVDNEEQFFEKLFSKSVTIDRFKELANFIIL